MSKQKQNSWVKGITLALLVLLVFSACNSVGLNGSATPTVSPSPSPSPTATPVASLRDLPVTLPMIDALFFVDRRFAERLKNDLQLSDEQIAALRQTVRNETAAMKSNEADDPGRTRAAGQLAQEKLSALLGSEKAEKLSILALQRWQAAAEGTGEEERPIALASPTLSATLDPRASASVSPTASASPGSSPSASPSASASPRTATPAALPSAPYSAPTDTRIVVNAPAYRMDVFENGKLVKSYKVSIGYPEFPLPTGMRKATNIIFNPSWTPPDEPWVESSNKVKVGQKIPAGDKLNPLGPIKIPIGLPSLIHGGKSLAKIGTFGSHGCVGLTNKQVQDFSKVLARLSGTELSDEVIARNEKDPTQTKSFKLPNSVPVELRYETVTVEDGKIHLYRDVYDRENKAGDNLETALSTYGASPSDLTEQERARLETALAILDKSPTGKADREKRATIAEMTKQLKQDKEITIDVAALSGKGYPTAAELDTGRPQKAQPPPPPKKRSK